MCTLFFSIAVIAVWPVFLYGKNNIGLFGSPFTKGGTIGNQWSDTEEVANSPRVKGSSFFMGEFLSNAGLFFQICEILMFCELFSCQISKIYIYLREIARFYPKFQQVAKNIEELQIRFFIFVFS